MLSSIRIKIRSLITDLSKKDFEPFTYKSGDKIFTLSESNINTITKVEKNGAELGSGQYSYDSTNNIVEVLIALSSGDIITVRYTYYKYSDTELAGFIRASLVWLSIFSYASETDYELEEDDIVPTPDNKTTDLIALISAILIQPDYTEYRLPNITVVYEGKETKEKRIEKLIMRFKRGLGVFGIIEF